MQKFTHLLLALATLLFAEHLLAQEIEYPSNKSILSAKGEPGYWRQREKNGIGLVYGRYDLVRLYEQIFLNNHYYFYDRTISSSFKLHFFLASYDGIYDSHYGQVENSAGNLLYRSDNYGGACNFDGGSRPTQYCPVEEYAHIEEEIKSNGVSLRNFPFYESGFFWGIGGGPIEYYQNLVLQWEPSWPYTPSPLYFKGIQYFIDLGWQGYNGFYFTSIHESEVQVLQKSRMNLTLSTGSLPIREETGLWEDMKLSKIPVI